MLVTGIDKKYEDRINPYPFTSGSTFKCAGLSLSPDLWQGASIYPDSAFSFPLEVSKITINKGITGTAVFVEISDSEGVLKCTLTNSGSTGFTDLWATSPSGKAAGVLSGDSVKLEEALSGAASGVYKVTSGSLVLVPSVCSSVLPAGFRGFTYGGADIKALTVAGSGGAAAVNTGRKLYINLSGASTATLPGVRRIYGKRVVGGNVSYVPYAVDGGDLVITASPESKARVMNNGNAIAILSMREL